MMINKTLMIVMSALLLPMALFGANPAKDEPVEDLTRNDVIARFTKLNNEIAEDLKTPDSVKYFYQQNAGMVNRWLKYSHFIEVDTEIDKSWYERAAKLLEYMGECKSYLILFVRKSEKDKSEKYQKVLANLKEAHKRFDALVKNPTPVERGKLERLRAEKAKWEAQHRREKEKKAGE